MAAVANKPVRFSDVMDSELLDEVATTNPFQDGVSWDMVATRLWESPSGHFLQVKSSKSFRDRTLLLLTKRRAEIAAEERASGIEVPDRTPVQVALDEILHLREEAELQKAAKADKRKRAVPEEEAIRAAAMQPLGREINEPVVAEVEAVPAPEAVPGPEAQLVQTPKRRRINDVVQLYEEEKQREEARFQHQSQERRAWREDQQEERRSYQTEMVNFKMREINARAEQAALDRELERERIQVERDRMEQERRDRAEERERMDKERRENMSERERMDQQRREREREMETARAEERKLLQQQIDNQRMMMEALISALKK